MAFEALLAHTRDDHGRRPRRWRRAMLTFSLLVHGAALAIALAYSFWQVDELPLPAVAVTLAGAPPPPPPPPAAAHRHASATRPKVKPQPRPETLVQPQERPQETPKPKPDESEEDGAQEGGVAGGVKGGVQGGVVGGVVGAAPVKDAGPRLLTPQIAKGLLLIDPSEERYRVKLPPALERAGATVSAILRVCVSAAGAVTEVRILKGAGPAIDPQIPSVIGRWRYRPLLIDGRPTPFCYPLRYEVTSR
jgi:periplasmic protein TonB